MPTVMPDLRFVAFQDMADIANACMIWTDGLLKNPFIHMYKPIAFFTCSVVFENFLCVSVSIPQNLKHG